MALIVMDGNQKGEYQKILLDRFYINLNGLYVTAIVFENKEQRDKDKARNPLVASFMQNIAIESERRKQIYPEGSILTEEQILDNENFSKAEYIAINYDLALWKWQNQTEEERIQLKDDFLVEAEKYGFQREWYTNPIRLMREETFWTDQYNKQDFTLEAFYSLVKENIYLKDGVQVADDI